MQFIKYSNGKITNICKVEQKDSLIFEKIVNITSIEKEVNHIYNTWKIAFGFYTKNMQSLLNSQNLKESYLFYQVKIILNAMHEYLDKMNKVLSKVFKDKETRTINNKPKTKSIEEWKLRDITTKTYDTSLAYRLCYNLRNYMQHVDDVGIYLYISAHEEKKIMIDIKTYCENHKGISNSMKKDASNLTYEDQRHDLNILIQKLNENIVQINNEIFSLLHPEIFEKSITYNLALLYIYSKHAYNADINAVEYEDISHGQRRTKICFIHIPTAKSIINKNFHIFFKKSPLNKMNSLTAQRIIIENENQEFALQYINKEPEDEKLINVSIKNFLDLID